MLTLIHKLAAATAFMLILMFFSASLMAELVADTGTIARVKAVIVYAVWLLLPAMAIAGLTGARLAGGRTTPVLQRKQRRMPIVAANGLLILLPAALYLNHLAAAGDFGLRFYSVQALELLAGLVNLSLLALNIRDGRRLRRPANPRPA